MLYQPSDYDLGITDLTPEQAAVEAEAARDLAEVLWGPDGPEPEAELHI
jgi:hypothetical protein